jgi:glycosyltransferase involved in cell wall biosynthesis
MGIAISVCIPTLNEERSLCGVLDSLVSQSLAPDEVVIADGGSTDRTVALARTFENRLPLVVLEIGRAFPGRGRNRAIAAARSDWVALLDAGCIAAPDWLRSLRSSAESSGAAIVFGTYEVAISTPWQDAQLLTVIQPRDARTGCRPPSTASMLIHRDAWRMVGGFPEDLRAAEDLVFFERLASRSLLTVRAPGAVVSWSPAPTWHSALLRLSEYSRHHAASGLTATWHQRVGAMNLAAFGLALASVWWPWALGLLACFGLGRLFRTVLIRGWRPGDDDSSRRLARASAMLLTADLAMWIGLVRHWTGRRLPKGDGVGEGPHVERQDP